MFRAGLEHENWLFFGIGISIMALSGLVSLIAFIRDRLVIKGLKKDLIVARQNFKEDSQKIRINLNKVEINSPLRTDALPEDGYNYLESDAMENLEKLSTFILKIYYSNQELDYPIKTKRDAATLSMLFSNQKETFLYMGRTDSTIVYLDLEFLG